MLILFFCKKIVLIIRIICLKVVRLCYWFFKGLFNLNINTQNPNNQAGNYLHIMRLFLPVWKVNYRMFGIFERIK